MANGDRHYSYCLKFSDEIQFDNNETDKKEIKSPEKKELKQEEVNILPVPQKFSFDDSAMNKISLRSSTECSIINKFTGLSAPSDFSPMIPVSPARPLGVDGHPLGEFGVNLTEQLKYAKSLHDTEGGDSLEGGESQIINEESASVETVTNRRNQRVMKRLERRGSQFEITKPTTKKEKNEEIEQHQQEQENMVPLVAERSASLDDSSISYTLTALSKNTIETSSSSVTTNTDSENESVTGSKKKLFSTKAIIILTKFPLCDFFKEYLKQFHKYITSKPSGKCKMIPIEKYISNLLFDVIFPPPGNDLRLIVHAPISPLHLYNPANNDLPLIDISLKPLLLCLDRKNLIQVFIGLTLERKFLFTSSNTNLLYQCIHALLLLLYPFEWQTGVVPIVPPSLLELTQAITPIILGIPAKYIDDLEVPEDVSTKIYLFKVNETN